MVDTVFIARCYCGGKSRHPKPEKIAKAAENDSLPKIARAVENSVIRSRK